MFVATFVYCVLVLVSIGPGDRGDFIPDISITTTFWLVLVSMAVLIYFIHHITSQIQLPQFIAGIAKDLAHAVEVQSADNPPLSKGCARRRTVAGRVDCDDRQLRQCRPNSGERLPSVHPPQDAREDRRSGRRGHSPALPPGAFPRRGTRAGGCVATRSGERAQVTGPHRTLNQDVAFGVDQLVEIAIRALSPAVNDTFTALTCIDWLRRQPVQIRTRMESDSGPSRPPRSHPRHHRSSQLRTFGAALV